MLLNEESIKLLIELSNLPGVSGNEDEVRNRLVELVSPYCDRVWIDRCGNVVTHIKAVGQTSKQHKPLRVLVTAHMDEVGFIITSVDKKGMLKFKCVGGIDERILPGQRVYVGKNKIPGVIGCKPIHLQSEKEYKKVFRQEDLRIDIGCESQKSALKYVSSGDYAVFATTAERFGDGLISGKALDDRVGCSVLVQLLKYVKNNLKSICFDLYVGFTTNEEIGLVGAKVLANGIQPDIGIAVEGTTCADVPGVEEYEASSRLGKGPVLTIMDRASVSDKALNSFIGNTAQILNIGFQYKNTVSGGNDAAALQKAASGAKVASVSVPCRYIHSPLSVLNEQDYFKVVELMTGFIKRLNETGGNINV